MSTLTELPLSPALRPFLQTVRQHPECTRFPVYATLFSDQLTPVTAFDRLARQRPYAFLLESVVGGEKIGRYSFIAIEPQTVITARGHEVHVGPPDARGDSRQSTDPMKDVADLLAGERGLTMPGLPRFCGGLVGFCGYDTVRYVEGKKLTSPPADDRQLPDLLFGLYDSMVIFDHVDKLIRVVSNARVPAGRRTPAMLTQAYIQAEQKIGQLVTQLNRTPTKLAQPPAPALDPGTRHKLQVKSNMTRRQYERMIAKAKEYIQAGDIFQVVLGQRLRVETSADPFQIYRALRVVNPSPFMFYLRSPELILVGASPEILCRVDNREVTNRPLAGTRRRGRNAAEDQALEAELLADAKDRAEHIMLVDLGRNDVGRVSRIGSVKLTECMQIERYSHVMHIVSEVRGELADGHDAFDALRAALPVGTVSGAPKVRAMQIIDELEPTRRGPYGGGVGYVDFSGNMDTCIALRTMVITESAAATPKTTRGKRGPVKKAVSKFTVDVQVGGGIVADSVPAEEFEETINKSKALIRAIEIAEGQMPS